MKATSRHSKTRMQGLTMIELLVTVTIMALLMAVAIPSFNSVIRDNRVLTGANSLVIAITQAKSEAIRRSRVITVCPSVNGTSCSGSDWTGGWVMVVEKTSVLVGAPSDPDPLVGSGGVLAVGSAMKNTTSTKTAGTKDWVRFTPRGMVEEILTLQFKPTTCSANTPFQEVSVGIAGRASIVRKSC